MKKENELLKVKKEVNTLFMVVSGLVCAIIGNFFHPLGAIIGFLVGGWLGHKYFRLYDEKGRKRW